MILIVDNYDSFVHNLARYIRQLGAETLVLRNDDSRLDNVSQLAPEAIVISPGPGTPAQSGKSLALIQKHMGKIPLLGVCLGHQAIVEAMGGRLAHAIEPMHGRTSKIYHDGHPMFSEIESPFQVCRYHSLVADAESIPERLSVTGRTDDGQIMAIANDSLKVYGIQFHPEAILSEFGYTLLANLLKLCSIKVSDSSLEVAYSTIQATHSEEQRVDH